MALQRIPSVGEALVAKAIELALDGNEKMICFLIDRYYDKNFLNRVEVPLRTKTAKDINESQGTIIEEMGQGNMEPDYGLMMIKALSIKRDSSVVKALEDKVNEITEGIE